MQAPFTPVRATALAALAALASMHVAAQAQSVGSGDLIVSEAIYVDPNFSVGAALPNSAGVNAVASSAFCSSSDCSQNVWNNDNVDANFGITGNIVLQGVNTATNTVTGTVDVTAAAASQGINLVTSFSSKSELAINVTPSGTSLTLMGYNTTAGKLDVSNSNTPGITEAGNTDTATATYRGVAQFNLNNNNVQYTTTNAYNGNNGRAAILGANGVYYTVGNAGNGNGGATTTAATGVQLIHPGVNATASTPGTTQVGQYSITQNGYAADKTAKDNNFRGEVIYNNTLYVTKGSGSNGIDTVYQVGAAGTLPTTGATISVLPGMNTQLAKTDAMTTHPFGLWFANSSTLYVADEGSGATTDFGPNATTQIGGIQKYSLVNGSWTLDYTLGGDILGKAYTVNGTGSLSGDSLTTYTDGFRNLTGRVNADGTVSLFATTSTAGSVLADSGADPNEVVSYTDVASATSAVANENATVIDAGALGVRYGGVALPVPEPESNGLAVFGLAVVGLIGRRLRRQA